ncbi:MAG: type II toxin-antitoxin system HicA family toxin [Dehalococcoidia bacterium]
MPRDLSGDEFASALARFGYRTTRQTGSHLRLTTREQGEHHLTVPLHRSLRVGTTSALLGEVAQHFGITKEQAIEVLFGK